MINHASSVSTGASNICRCTRGGVVLRHRSCVDVIKTDVPRSVASVAVQPQLGDVTQVVAGTG